MLALRETPKSMTHEVFYALHLMHEGHEDCIVEIIESSFFSFLSPYYLSLHFIPGLESTLMPWFHTLCLTAYTWAILEIGCEEKNPDLSISQVQIRLRTCITIVDPPFCPPSTCPIRYLFSTLQQFPGGPITTRVVFFFFFLSHLGDFGWGTYLTPLWLLASLFRLRII